MLGTTWYLGQNLFLRFLKLEGKIEYKKTHPELYMYELFYIVYTICGKGLERKEKLFPTQYEGWNNICFKGDPRAMQPMVPLTVVVT